MNLIFQAELSVDGQGFGRRDGESFNTFDIVEAWLRCPLPVA